MARQGKQNKSRTSDDIPRRNVSNIILQQSLDSKKCNPKHIILFWNNLCLQHYKVAHAETEVSD